MPTLLAGNVRTLPSLGRNRSYTFENGVKVVVNLPSRSSITTALSQAMDNETFSIPTSVSIHSLTDTPSNASDHITFGENYFNFTVSAHRIRGIGYVVALPSSHYIADTVMHRLVTSAINSAINNRPISSLEAIGNDLGITFASVRHVSNAEYRASFNDRVVTTSGSWVDSSARFQNSYNKIKSSTIVHPEMITSGDSLDGFADPYAINGGRTFGIEIEVDFPTEQIYGTAKARVAQEMYNAGLSDSPMVRGWHWRGRQEDNRGRSLGGGYTDARNGWSVEFDRSVDDVGGARGCEIVSPIISNSEQAWKDVAKIVEIIINNGGVVSSRHGLHVNLGARDISHDQGVHYRLIRLTRQFDDLLIRLAHTPEVGGTHRGRGYCDLDRYSHHVNISIADMRYNNNHRCAVNLDHVPANNQQARSSTRIEFRMFDGTLSVGRIQTNVMMCMALVHAAVRGTDLNVGFDVEAAGSHQSNRTSRRRLTGEAWEADTLRIRQFCDSMMFSDEARERVLTCYNTSRWQQI